MEYRVFKLDVGWAYAIFYFPMNVKWDMIKSHIRTSNLVKTDYVGKFEFDEKYLKIYESDELFNIRYYYFYYMTTD